MNGVVRKVRTAVVIAATIFAAALAESTVLVPAELTELAREARVIARGRVTATEAVWNGDWRTIETIVTLEVESPLKGAAGQPTLQFRVPGGELGRFHRVFIGAPRFPVGDRVIVFLGPAYAGWPSVLGLSQGVFRVAPAGDGWVVTPPAVHSVDGLPQPLIRGDLSRHPAPLDEFEQRVRALAGEAP